MPSMLSERIAALRKERGLTAESVLPPDFVFL